MNDSRPVVRYYNTGTEVLLSDRVRVRTRSVGEQEGRVIYVPGLSKPHKMLERDGWTWVVIQCPERRVFVGVSPKSAFLQKDATFLGRGPNEVPDFQIEECIPICYHANNVEVCLGDHVEARVWCIWKRRGRIVYVPGRSKLHKEMEHDGLLWVGVQCPGMLVSIVVEPDSFLVKQGLVFIKRDSTGYREIQPEDPLSEDS